MPNNKVLSFPDGMSQDEMRNAIYKNFPEYTPKYNEQQNKENTDNTGFKGILSDIGESLTNAPGAAFDALKELPEEAYESGKQILTHPVRALENVGAGLGEAAKGAFNLPLNLASYLGKKEIPYFKQIAPIAENLKIGDTGLQEAVIGKEKKGDKLLQALSSFSPYAKLGGIGKGASAVGRRAALAGAYGAGQNQDPLTAALVGLAGEGLTKGMQDLGKIKKVIRPSSPLSAQQLEDALISTRGTETGLGRVIDNPSLNRVYENILPNVIGSGAETTMQRTADSLINKGDTLLKDLAGGNVSTNYGVELQQALKEAANVAAKNKRERFEKVNKIAESNNVTTNRGNLRERASSLLDRIESDPDLASFRSPADINLLENISKPPKDKDTFSLKDSDYLRAEIGERRYDAFINGDTPKANLYRELQEAVEKDIDNAIESSSNPKLKEARKNAMEYYKSEYAPFESDEIVKFTRKGGDPDLMLSHFIRGGKNDRATLLKKLSERLAIKPGQDKHLLASAYLSRAIDETGTVNPLKLRDLYKKLGKNQRKALFTDSKTHQSVKQFSDLVGKNAEAFKLMLNPKTGARNTELLSKIGQMVTGWAAGGIPGVIASTAASGIGGRLATHLLTSPKIREKLVKKMIEQKNKPPTQSKNIAPLIQALMSAQAGHNPLQFQDTAFDGRGGE
ncbi:MAG TPA: hypothetical protein VK625_18285 [Flavitalea sp.]|nr:hypothetical protein [Flavitalea sp.]